MQKSLLRKTKKAASKLAVIVTVIVVTFVIIGLSEGTGAIGEMASFLIVLGVMALALFVGLPRLLKIAKR